MSWKRSGRQKNRLWRAQHIKAELEHARQDLDVARRAGDLAKMSELHYGRIPDLENNSI